MERVRLGIVGIGNIAQLNVLGYLEHPQCDVLALCDTRKEEAERKAAAWGVPKAYTGLGDMLADPDIDAVEILTPTDLHKEHVLAAIAAGKHVSCQKPIANSVQDALEMVTAANAAGVTLRVSECYFHYPPLLKARQLIRDGAIGSPTMVRIKTVVGDSDSEFSRNLQPEGYAWRFDNRSPGGHLFDDMIHKFATAPWIVDTEIQSVQAIVRQGPLFFEAPTAAIFEYEREDLLGTMEVAYAPRMQMRSSYYGADEFFEVQGTDGLIWVTRCTGEMLDLAPVMLFRGDGVTESFTNVNADWGAGFIGSSRHFIDCLISGETPDMTGDQAIKALQLCFATYEASNTRSPVRLDSIETSVSPPGWPKTGDQLLRDAQDLGLV